MDKARATMRQGPREEVQSTSVAQGNAGRSNSRSSSSSSSADVGESDSEHSDVAEQSPQVKVSSAQWLDFQKLTDRITSTVQRTQASLKKLASSGRDGSDASRATTAGGAALLTGDVWDSSSLPQAGIDSSSQPGRVPEPEQQGYVAMEFDDDYDPLKKTDVVGIAFGEKPFAKSKAATARANRQTEAAAEVMAAAFEDQYDPGVDSSDPLASAFGDGYRATKAALPPDIGFESSFAAAVLKSAERTAETGGSGSKGSLGSSDPAAAPGVKVPPSRPKAPPMAAASAPTKGKETKPISNGASSASAARQPAASEAGTTAAARPAPPCAGVGPAAPATVLIDDLLGLSLTSDCGQAADAAVAQKSSPRSTVQINIIEASIEEACADESALDENSSGSERVSSTRAGARSASEDDVESSFEFVDGRAALALSSDSSSGTAALDEFDAIVHRLDSDLLPEPNVASPAGIAFSAWSDAPMLVSVGATPEFEVDFSSVRESDVRRDFEVGFPSLSPFDTLVQTSPVSDVPLSDDDTAGNGPASPTGDPFSPAATKTSTRDVIISPMTNDEASVKRVVKFARTFSETVNEEDDVDPKLIGLTGGDNFGKVGDSSYDDIAAACTPFTSPSPLQFVVDMTKPSPAIKRQPGDAKKPANSLNIRPQSARLAAAKSAAQTVGQVTTKAVPRPKALRPSTATTATAPAASSDGREGSQARPLSASKPPRRSGEGINRKIATQGQADLLSLAEQRAVVTLAFDIESPDGASPPEGRAASTASSLPLLPPPPSPSAAASATAGRQQKKRSSSKGREPSDSEADDDRVDGRTTAATTASIGAVSAAVEAVAPLLVDLGSDVATPADAGGSHRGGSTAVTHLTGENASSTALPACTATAADRSPVTAVDEPSAAAEASVGDGTVATTDVPLLDDGGGRLALPPLEDFRPKYTGDGWTLLLRKPPKKSLTKKRFWEEVFVRLVRDDRGVKLAFYRNERAALKGEAALSELKLCAGHQLTPGLSLQQHDQYGKCHSVKLLHVHYRERPSVRAADRVAEALPGFLKSYVRRAASLQPVATSGPSSSAARAGGSAGGAATAAVTALLEHVQQTTELAKFGGTDAPAMRSFVGELEDALMALPDAERIGANIRYEKEEIVADVWDEYEALVDSRGHIVRQKARVRLFVLAFVSGTPTLELGINDRRRKGKEVVGRLDIVPVRAENWVNVECPELHRLVKRKEYEECGNIRFQPLDACKFELMRFRYRPKANYELPLQLDARMTVDREKKLVEIRADVMIPGYYSNSKRKGQVPCEDIQIAFPIPEEWIYKFRVEKHFKYGSLHAAARRPGKIKGIERLTSAMGSVVNSYLSSSFIECSVGDAKYEHVFHAVVWRIDCLPLRNQGAYKTHYFALRLELGSHDVVPDAFQLNASVEFTMPHTTVSGTAVRSVSNCSTSEPLEKWVYHHARFNYTVEMSFDKEIKDLLPKDAPGPDDDDSLAAAATAPSVTAAAATDLRDTEESSRSAGGSSASSSSDDEDGDDAVESVMPVRIRSGGNSAAGEERVAASDSGMSASAPTADDASGGVGRLLDL